MFEINDLELFNKIKANDLKSFDALFLKYYQPLCRFSCSMVNDKDAAEDIVQELLVYIWNNRAEITINIAVRPFLYTSVKNRSLNYIKSKNSRRNYEAAHYDLVFEESTDEIEAETNETLYLIEQGINNLPEKCREIFLLSRKENLKYNEIAEKLNLSAKTVENQMGIALKKMRDYLSPYRELCWIGLICQLVNVLM